MDRNYMLYLAGVINENQMMNTMPTPNQQPQQAQSAQLPTPNQQAKPVNPQAVAAQLQKTLFQSIQQLGIDPNQLKADIDNLVKKTTDMLQKNQLPAPSMQQPQAGQTQLPTPGMR